MGGAQVLTSFRSSAFFLAALSLVTLALPAKAEQCSLAHGSIGGIDGMPEVRQEECPLGPDGKSGQLRVTRLRMSEALAGMIAKGNVLPELANLFGDAPVIENEILATLKDVYGKFAHSTTYQASAVSVSIRVQPPRTGNSDDESSESLTSDVSLQTVGSGQRTLWSITSPFGDDSITHPLYDPDLMHKIFHSAEWPAGYKQSYKECVKSEDEYGEPRKPNENEPGACILLWHNIGIDEFAAIEKTTIAIFRKYHTPTPKTSTPKDFDWEDPEQRFRSHFAFLRYIGAQHWPDGFLQTRIAVNGLGCPWEALLSYFVIPLSLDVAILENVSDQAIALEKILGSYDSGKTLRAVAPPDASVTTTLTAQSITVPANGRVILPLRIIFDGGDPKDEDLSGQIDYFRKIQSRASGHIFKSKVYPSEHPEDAKFEDEGYVLLKKRREAFSEPAANDPTQFVYGPEITLTGLAVTSRELSLEGQSPTTVMLSGWSDESNALPSMSLDQNPGAGESCPVLYFRQPEQTAWIRHGKVIADARGADKEQTERIEVPPGTRVFRLSEEEPERAYIRDLRLELTLTDGRTLKFEPISHPRRSELLFEVPAYTHVEIEFDVPQSIEAVGIARSKLLITGHYRRLASMLFSSLFERSQTKDVRQCVGTGTQTICPIGVR